MFSPELQPTPEALKAKQLPAWAIMTSNSGGNGNNNNNNNMVQNILMSRQRMLNLGHQQDNNINASNDFDGATPRKNSNNNNNNNNSYQISEEQDRAMKLTAASSAKLQRPSIETLVKTLKAEKEDLIAGRTPKTRHGLPLGGGGGGKDMVNDDEQQQPSTPIQQRQQNLYNGSTPTPASSSNNIIASNKFGPISNTPEAAKFATGMDFSRRREFEWDARLHRISKMDSSPDPKLYSYDTEKKDFHERKSLNAPPKGLRKSDW